MQKGEVVDGRFRVIARAGKGAFGTVYRAHDERTRADAALKIFDGEHADLSRFEREAELLASLEHPRIVRFVAHGFTEAGTAYLAMEWLEGCHLAEKLEQGPLSHKDSLYLALRVAEGLSAAHARGVVHRDIKPTNLFLVGGQPEQVRLLDFGIARKEDEATKLTQTGTVIGTPGYMAPEQIRGVRELSPAADVFSLGCVLFECVTGEPAFVGPNGPAVLARMVSDPIPRLSRWIRNAPVGLDALVARMMARNAFERFVDASAAALAISDVLADPSAVAPRSRELAAVSSEPTKMVSTLVFSGAAGLAETVVRNVSAFGGLVQKQDATTVVATIALDDAPEAARLAVLCARAVLSNESGLRTAILSSRGGSGVPDESGLQSVLGGVRPEPGRILVDSLTASLLSRSFVLTREGPIAWVAADPSGAGESDLIHLGRARELALLAGSFQAASEERCSRLAVVTGSAGIGKSRLLRALAERLAKSEAPPRILFSHADTSTRTSPFELLRTFVRARHGELMRGGVPSFVDALVAKGMSPLDAQALASMAAVGPVQASDTVDPIVLADRIRCAWLGFLDLELEASPLMLIAEDLHMSDAASIRLLGVAVDQLRSRPLFVVASARVEDDASVLDFWSALEVERVALQPLRPQLAAELVQRLFSGAEQKQVDDIVARAAGNPLRIRELVRINQHGEAEVVGGTFDARLLRLPANAGRAVRCGSIFGLRFSAAGVARLLGEDPSAVEASLEAAVQAELLRETLDRWEPKKRGYVFAHGVLQEAAYAQLDSNELKAAHREAGTWLAEQRGADPSVIAWHFERGSDERLAIPWFVAAARAALVGGEPSRALRLADEAIRCAGDPNDVADAELLRAEAQLALGDTLEGLRAAETTLSRAKSGSPVWLRAASIVVTCAGQRGDNDRVASTGNALVALEPEAGAEGAWVLGLCQVASQLFAAGRHSEAESFGAAAARRGCDRPEAQAGIAIVRSTQAIRALDLEQALEFFSDAARLQAIAGNLRASVLMRVHRASTLIFAGDCDAASLELDAAESLSRRTGADYYLRWARYSRGKILAIIGDPWAAKAHLESVRRDLAGNPRIVAGTHIYAALAALRAGDGDWAEDESRRARSAHGSVPVRAVAQAALARAHVLQRRAPEALECASEAKALLEGLGAIEENENVVHLALPEALDACGRPADALVHAEAALKRLFSIAAKFANPSRRAAFLHNHETHVAIVRLAHRLGLAVPALD